MSHFLALVLSNTDGIRVCLCNIATEINFSRFSGRQVLLCRTMEPASWFIYREDTDELVHSYGLRRDLRGLFAIGGG